MAETVTLPRRMVIAAVLFIAQTGVHAQSLQDPTRPAVTQASGDGDEIGLGPQLQSDRKSVV